MISFYPDDNDLFFGLNVRPKLKWTPPKGRDIVYACSKDGNPDVVLILLDDGSIYETVYEGFIGTWDNPPKLRSKADPKDQFQSYKSIVGDALYALSDLAVYVSRDIATTWSVDSAGVGA